MTYLRRYIDSVESAKTNLGLARTPSRRSLAPTDHWPLCHEVAVFPSSCYFQKLTENDVCGTRSLAKTFTFCLICRDLSWVLSLRLFAKCSCSVNRAIINSQDARQPDSARRQEISPNYYIHIVSNAHFTASANLKWQVPTFHSKITIFVLFYYMVIFVHYFGYVNLVL